MDQAFFPAVFINYDFEKKNETEEFLPHGYNLSNWNTHTKKIYNQNFIIGE